MVGDQKVAEADSHLWQVVVDSPRVWAEIDLTRPRVLQSPPSVVDGWDSSRGDDYYCWTPAVEVLVGGDA